MKSFKMSKISQDEDFFKYVINYIFKLKYIYFIVYYIKTLSKNKSSISRITCHITCIAIFQPKLRGRFITNRANLKLLLKK